MEAVGLILTLGLGLAVFFSLMKGNKKPMKCDSCHKEFTSFKKRHCDYGTDYHCPHCNRRFDMHFG